MPNTREEARLVPRFSEYDIVRAIGITGMSMEDAQLLLLHLDEVAERREVRYSASTFMHIVGPAGAEEEVPCDVYLVQRDS